MWGWPWLRPMLAVVLTSVVAATVAFVVVAVRPTEYQARSVVDVSKVADAPEDFSNTDIADRSLADELLVAQSGRVLAIAARESDTSMRSADDVFAADTVEGTNAIAFTAVGDDPQGAANDANTYARAYVNFSLATQASAIQTQRSTLTQTVEDELETLNQLDPAVTERLRTTAIERLATDLAELARSEAALQRRSAAGILVQPAQPPRGPAGAGPRLAAAVAGFLAALVALAVMFVVSGSSRPVGRR